MSRRILFEIHSWLGLKLSLLMTFILVTGTLAVLGHELDWLVNSEMRAIPMADTEVISWGEVYDAAVRAYPDGEIFYLRHTARESWWASEADFRTPSGNLVRVWINPYTGAYQGATGWFNIQRFFRQAHRHLMLPNDIGIPIVTMLAFPLLLALASGLVIYKKFWRGFLKRPRFEKTARIWLGDLHRLGALWSLWFLPIIALTSVWYLVEELGGNAPGLPRAGAVVERTWPLPSDFDGDTLNRIVGAARTNMPELKINSIRFPAKPSDSLKLEGQTGVLLVRDRANAVYVDPANGKVTGRFRGDDLTVHQRISEMADPLHFGTWGGLTAKLIWFVLGAMLSALSITGIYIYGLRVVQGQQREKYRARALPDVSVSS